MLISLDMAVPFYKFLGLTLKGDIPFKDCMRDFIRMRRELDPASDEASWDAAREVFSFTSSRLGPDAGDLFRWWCDNAYCESHKEYPNLAHWTLLLRNARRQQRDWNAVNFPRAIRAEARQRFDASVDMTDYYEVVAGEAKDSALSDWDLHLYTANLWNDDLPDAPNGPESYFYPIACKVQRSLFWNWFLDSSSESEQAELHRAAQALITEYPDLSFISSLCHPSTLQMEMP